MSARFVGHVELPLQRVHLELTNVFQFNCVFCPKSEMTRSPGFMDTDPAKRLISDIRRHDICKMITFHVMGEPTLHPDFFDILDHARDEADSRNSGLCILTAGSASAAALRRHGC